MAHEQHVADAASGFWANLKQALGVGFAGYLLSVLKGMSSSKKIKDHVNQSEARLDQSISSLHDRMDTMDENREQARTQQDGKNKEMTEQLTDLKQEQFKQGFILLQIAKKMDIEVPE